MDWCYLQAKTTQLPNGLLQDEFEKTTVNMSTYLVAFIVADFSPVSRNVSETLVSLIYFYALCRMCELTVQTTHFYQAVAFWLMKWIHVSLLV